jgi:hypothetical protein
MGADCAVNLSRVGFELTREGVMKIGKVPFDVFDWNHLTQSTVAGETGTASHRAVKLEAARIRMVRYSSGYLSDHWCEQGHFGYVIDGEVGLELRDGSSYTLVSGMSFQIPDDSSPHRISSAPGALLLIVD